LRENVIMPRKQELALAYYRANDTTGGREDNLPRQQKLVRAFAKKNRLKLAGEFLDIVKQGIGFDQLLSELERQMVKVVIVSDASTLAHSPIARETAILMLKARGVTCITCAGDDLTNDPARAPMREAALSFGRDEALSLAMRVLNVVIAGRKAALARAA
jgi:DNA invertase Pin-like site-specific DNA recombinase